MMFPRESFADSNENYNQWFQKKVKSTEMLLVGYIHAKLT